MSEETLSSKDPKQEIVDYYFHDTPQDQKLKQQYLERGLVPTNNFYLYFLQNSQEDIAEGLPNPYNYALAPFGAILQKFKDSQPELWARVQEISDQLRGASKVIGTDRLPQTEDVYKALLVSSNEASDKLRWEREEILNKVIDAVMPDLIDANISPVELIK